MKKLLILLLFLPLVGCDNPKTPDLDESTGVGWTSIEYKNHRYLINGMTRDRTMVHDPDCPWDKK